MIHNFLKLKTSLEKTKCFIAAKVDNTTKDVLENFSLLIICCILTYILYNMTDRTYRSRSFNIVKYSLKSQHFFYFSHKQLRCLQLSCFNSLLKTQRASSHPTTNLCWMKLIRLIKMLLICGYVSTNSFNANLLIRLSCTTFEYLLLEKLHKMIPERDCYKQEDSLNVWMNLLLIVFQLYKKLRVETSKVLLDLVQLYTNMYLRFSPNMSASRESSLFFMGRCDFLLKSDYCIYNLN